MATPPSDLKQTSPEIRAFLDDVQDIQKAGASEGRSPPFKLLGKLPKRVAYLRSVRARQQRPVRDVEIRLLPAGTPPDLARLFERELDDLVRLDHPTFLPVLMVGKIDGRECYAVPLRSGTPLPAMVADDQVGVARRAGWVRTLASGLAAAHRRRILIGNIRPELLHLDHATDALHYVHHVGHDPTWPSPHLVQGRLGDEVQRPTLATDVYYWALQALWLLTGGDLPETGDLPPAKTLVPKLSDDLAGVLDGCLAIDPSDRPENGLFLVELLQVYAEDCATPGRAPSTPDLQSTLAEIRSSGRLDEDLLGQLRKETPPPPAGPVSIASLLASDEARGVTLEPRTLAVLVALVVGLVVLLVAWMPGRAPVRTAARTHEPPPGAEAWIPENRAHWELKPLPPSTQEEFKRDERIRTLLTLGRATPENFSETWRTLRTLCTNRRLPRPLDGWGRILAMKQSFSQDPEVGARELTAFLDDLRTLLEQA